MIILIPARAQQDTFNVYCVFEEYDIVTWWIPTKLVKMAGTLDVSNGRPNYKEHLYKILVIGEFGVGRYIIAFN